MPWVSNEMCTGCGICVEECCADAISMDGETASIDEDDCIRCGVCHDVCPSDAVRHDGERIPEEVQSNIDWVEELLKHPYYTRDSEKRGELFDRLQRYFTKNKKVTEKTLERLKLLKDSEFREDR